MFDISFVRGSEQSASHLVMEPVLVKYCLNNSQVTLNK